MQWEEIGDLKWIFFTSPPPSNSTKALCLLSSNFYFRNQRLKPEASAGRVVVEETESDCAFTKADEWQAYFTEAGIYINPAEPFILCTKGLSC